MEVVLAAVRHDVNNDDAKTEIKRFDCRNWAPLWEDGWSQRPHFLLNFL